MGLCIHIRICRSAAKLAYSNAQAVLDGKPLGGIPVIPEHNAVDLEHDIKVLYDLSKQLRSRRSQAGFLGSESLRITFTLDERGHPIDCGSYKKSEANDIVEEASPC